MAFLVLSSAVCCDSGVPFRPSGDAREGKSNRKALKHERVDKSQRRPTLNSTEKSRCLKTLPRHCVKNRVFRWKVCIRTLSLTQTSRARARFLRQCLGRVCKKRPRNSFLRTLGVKLLQKTPQTCPKASPESVSRQKRSKTVKSARRVHGSTVFNRGRLSFLLFFRAPK